MEKLEGHVFISYVWEDSSEVDVLQRTLEAAGIQVWRDKADLWPGMDWRMMIRRAITDDALVFIACFSSRSVARKKTYQNEELALAIEQLRLRRPDEPWLIPVRLDDCVIPDLDIGGSRTLGSIQRVDLFGDHRDRGMARLVAAILRILGWPSKPAVIEDNVGDSARNSIHEAIELKDLQIVRGCPDRDNTDIYTSLEHRLIFRNYADVPIWYSMQDISVNVNGLSATPERRNDRYRINVGDSDTYILGLNMPPQAGPAIGTLHYRIWYGPRTERDLYEQEYWYEYRNVPQIDGRSSSTSYWRASGGHDERRVIPSE